MIVDLVILAVAFGAILLGAELFTNGIEWLGHKLGIAEGAVGSVLAAVGTALPETTIPLIAIVFTGGAAASEVGVGAILGAPLMLATLAFFVLGVTVLAMAARRTSSDRLDVSPGLLLTDARTFGVAYALAIGVAFLPSDLAWPRWVVAAILIAIYVRYVRNHLAAERSAEGEELAPLRMQRVARLAGPARTVREPEVAGLGFGHPTLSLVTVQVLIGVAFIVVGATLFVGAIERLTASLGLDATLLALVVAPMATELPEAANGVLWARRGKDGLAVGNITGAMVFQATIPTVIALVFASSEWAVTRDTAIAFASAGIAFASLIVLLAPVARGRPLTGRRLLLGGAFYAAYFVIVVVDLAGAR